MSSERIKSWPTNERPRERLFAEGPERLTDADLLAIILRVGSGTFKVGVSGTNAYEVNTLFDVRKWPRSLMGFRDREKSRLVLLKPRVFS
ncbi:MAG: hypothetical protein K0B01_08585 [Syntrophobacterales bacterium]|nr:hypothetical protein [Syntrophobacterales bacterium]